MEAAFWEVHRQVEAAFWEVHRQVEVAFWEVRRKTSAVHTKALVWVHHMMA